MITSAWWIDTMHVHLKAPVSSDTIDLGSGPQAQQLLAHAAAAGDHEQVDVVVAVGGWEHACCGPAIERDQLVDLGCLRVTAPDGGADLSETHHDLEPDIRVQGRVRDIQVARLGRPAQPVLRLPSGQALRGFDDEDDGHLEDPWTGELLPDGDDFVLIVDVR